METFQGQKPAKVEKAARETKGMFESLIGASLGPIDSFMSFFDSLGVMQPVMDMLNGVMSVFSGAIMKELIPAFKTLAEFLFSPEMIAKITNLGIRFGDFLAKIVFDLIGLLDNPTFMNILSLFVNAIGWVFTFIGGTIGAFLNMISTWDPWQVAALFIILGTGIAFLVGVMMGGFTVAGLILGGVLAAATAILLTTAFASSSVPSFQHGGIMPYTGLAHLEKGERVATAYENREMIDLLQEISNSNRRILQDKEFRHR